MQVINNFDGYDYTRMLGWTAMSLPFGLAVGDRLPVDFFSFVFAPPVEAPPSSRSCAAVTPAVAVPFRSPFVSASQPEKGKQTPVVLTHF